MYVYVHIAALYMYIQQYIQICTYKNIHIYMYILYN